MIKALPGWAAILASLCRAVICRALYHTLFYRGHCVAPCRIQVVKQRIARTLLDATAVHPGCWSAFQIIEDSIHVIVADDASDQGSDEGSEEPEADEEEEQPKHDISVKTTGYDARFPSYNQARNCYTRYNEYHRCVGVDDKGEDDPECKSYQRAYRSICPMEWVNSWNEQRDTGTWPGKY